MLELEGLPATHTKNRYRQLLFNWYCSKADFASVLYPAELRKRAEKLLNDNGVVETDIVKILKEINLASPPEGEMPWDDPSLLWEKPTRQVAVILRFMWNRQQADWREFVNHVWGDDDDVDDNRVKAARSRTNNYLLMHKYNRSLEKPRGEEIIRWV